MKIATTIFVKCECCTVKIYIKIYTNKILYLIENQFSSLNVKTQIHCFMYARVCGWAVLLMCLEEWSIEIEMNLLLSCKREFYARVCLLYTERYEHCFFCMHAVCISSNDTTIYTTVTFHFLLGKNKYQNKGISLKRQIY